MPSDTSATAAFASNAESLFAARQCGAHALVEENSFVVHDAKTPNVASATPDTASSAHVTPGTGRRTIQVAA